MSAAFTSFQKGHLDPLGTSLLETCYQQLSPHFNSLATRNTKFPDRKMDTQRSDVTSSRNGDHRSQSTEHYKKKAKCIETTLRAAGNIS